MKVEASLTNLLPPEQRSVIDLFHYALDPGGYLLLGTAETLLSEARRRGGNCVLHKIPDEAAASRLRDDQNRHVLLQPRLESGRAHQI